jgi:hypothetical protein
MASHRRKGGWCGICVAEAEPSLQGIESVARNKRAELRMKWRLL